MGGISVKRRFPTLQVCQVKTFRETLSSGNTAIKSIRLTEIGVLNIFYMQESMPSLINMATVVNSMMFSLI